jgi:hypothetical protein
MTATDAPNTEASTAASMSTERTIQAGVFDDVGALAFGTPTRLEVLLSLCYSKAQFVLLGQVCNVQPTHPSLRILRTHSVCISI